MQRYFRLGRTFGVGKIQHQLTEPPSRNAVLETSAMHWVPLDSVSSPSVPIARRYFLLGTGGFFISGSGLPLVGCARSNSGGSDPNVVDALPPEARAVGISGTVVLQLGVSFGNISLVTGGSELTLVQATLSAQVPGAIPTIACVIDNATGQVILRCIIAPTLHSVTLDALNVAGTLIFLFLGGWVLETTRGQLWSQVLADPATATFATVVQARLDADHYAAIDGDAALVAGLKVALSSLKIKTPVVDSVQSESAEKSATRSIKAPSAPQTSLPALPDPFVGIPRAPFFERTTGFSFYQQGTANQSLTYFQYVNSDVIERTFLPAYILSSTPTDVTEVQIGDPIVVSPNSSTNFMAIPLRNAEDVVEAVSIWAVAPIFDFPVSTDVGATLRALTDQSFETTTPERPTSSQHVNLLPELQALEVASWERASVGLGVDFIVSGLGGTVSPPMTPARSIW